MATPRKKRETKGPAMRPPSNLGQELWNIYRHQPLWPGDTLSHATANELVRQGLAERTNDGSFVLTEKGRQLVMV